MIRRLLRRVASSPALPRLAPRPAPAIAVGPRARPRVSVVLGSYNRRAFLEAAIESVCRDAEDIAHEIIVVDGGSTDGSLEWLTARRDIVTIVQHNRGEVRGRPVARRSWGYFMNLAFKAAQGEWVLMISDDVLVLPGCIPAALARAEAATAEGSRVGGIAFYFRNWPAEQRYYVQETTGGRLMVNHGLFAREALEAVGFIDEETYVFYKADGDLALRIWEAGFVIIDSPGSVVEHHMDEAEAVRQSNNETLARDRAAYARRWGHLPGRPGRHELAAAPAGAGLAEEVFGTIRAAAARSGA